LPDEVWEAGTPLWKIDAKASVDGWPQPEPAHG